MSYSKNLYISDSDDNVQQIDVSTIIDYVSDIGVGATGVQGFTGSTGIQGFNGATGIQGNPGQRVPTGPTGVQGFTGATGIQGFTGATGIQGNPGNRGPTGPTGIQGLTGATGSVSNDVNGNLSVNGSVTATSFNAGSDYRIKENVTQLDISSFNTDSLNPVTYLNKNIEKQDIGFIAHEVQKIYPFLVNGEKDGKEIQSLNYIGLIGILTKEIQELKKEIKLIKNELVNLKK